MIKMKLEGLRLAVKQSKHEMNCEDIDCKVCTFNKSQCDDGFFRW